MELSLLYILVDAEVSFAGANRSTRDKITLRYY